MKRGYVAKVNPFVRAANENGRELRVIDAIVFATDPADGVEKFFDVEIEIDLHRIVTRMGIGAALNKTGNAGLGHRMIVGKATKRGAS